MVRVSEVTAFQSGRIKISLDNGSVYVLLKSIYRMRPVKPNEEIDENEFSKWVLIHQYRAALTRAVSMLSARACSKEEIRQRLQRMHFSSETIDMVLYKLESNQLLDDRAFARQWVNYRAGQHFGMRRIQQELRHKGVAQDMVDEAMDAVSEESELDQALELIHKKTRNETWDKDSWEKSQRLVGYLVRRGYTWDMARKAVQIFRQEQETV